MDKNLIMTKEVPKPYGYIYVSTNLINGKNYVGQTVTSRWEDDKIPIDERWNEEVDQAYRRDKRGEKLRFVEKAIIKYGSENFKLVEKDTAQNQEELNEKENNWMREYDSLNPDKGYNVMEVGRGGRLTQYVKEKMRKSHEEQWQNDRQYIEKQLKARLELKNNSEFINKMKKINREITSKPEYKEKMSNIISGKWQKDLEYQKNQLKERRERGDDPKFREKMKKAGSKKWENDPEYQKKQLQERRERGDDPKFRDKMRDINREKRKEITDKREFLEDIQKMQSNEIAKKYDMNRSTVNKRIREMLGDHGVKNSTEARNYLEGKNLDEVVKDINERLDKPFQNYEGKPISSNKREFLEDIKNMQKNEIDFKYKMDAKSVTRKIREILGEYGVKNYTEAKKYLNGKNLDEVLKDIEQRSVEKLDDNKVSEGMSQKNDEDPKEQKEKEVKKSEVSEDKRGVDREKEQEKTEEGQKEKEAKEPTEKPAEQQEKEIKNSQESLHEEAREKPDNQSSESSDDLNDKHSEEPTEGPNKTESESPPEHEDGEVRKLEDVSTDQPGNQAEKTPETKSNVSFENTDQNISLGPRGKKQKTKEITIKVRDIIIRNGVRYVVKEIRPATKLNLIVDTFQGVTEGLVRRDIDGIDQINLDNQNDYDGVGDLSDSGDEDYHGLDEDLPEEGSDFDGIDNPLENVDSDYDKVAEEYSDGGESGGGS